MKDEALKLALEALETELAVDMTNGAEVGEAAELMCEAITAIKQALALDKMADNARELGLDYEPADGTQVSKVWWDGEKLMAKPIPLVDFYQPAPVQEPVAWEIRQGKTDRVLLEITNDPKRAHEWRCSLGEVVPLYAAPHVLQREWTGLTDEERDAIFEIHHTRLGGWDHGGDEVMYDRHFEDAVIAIEAKLKEKNAAAQPAVPDALFRHAPEHPQYIQGWNDCRAEMLKGMKP